MNTEAVKVLVDAEHNQQLQSIGYKIINKERISFEEGVALFEQASLSYVGALSNWVREQKHGHKTYFNRRCAGGKRTNGDSVTRREIFLL